MTAIAEGIKNSESILDLSYFLHDYPVQVVETQKDVALTRKCAVIERNDGKTNIVQLSGGILTSVELQWLNGGDVGYLEKAVKGSRPSGRTLYWRVPLDRWEFPNVNGLLARRIVAMPLSRGGCSVINSSVVLSRQPVAMNQAFGGFGGLSQTAQRINTKGIQMRMVVRETSFRKDTRLDSLRDRILRDMR
jgi:hypothetical protein